MADAKINISAQDNASRILDKVRGSINEVNIVAQRAGAALGLIGVAGVGGLVAMAKSAVDGIDRLNDLSDATGSSVENISALENIAARTGTSMDTVSTAMIKFNGALKDAKPGSGAELALSALGLSVKELREMDPAEALMKTAVALSGFADDGNKARIVQELFGKSLKEVAPLLNDLANKGTLVSTVTTDAAKQAEKFNQELFNLQKNSTDSARSISSFLVTAINASIERFRLGAIAGKGFWEVLRGDQLRALGLNDGPEEYAAKLAKVNDQLAKGEPRVLVRNALLREQASLQAKLKALPDFGADNQSAAEMARLSRRPGLAPLPEKDKPEAKGKDPNADFNAYLKALDEQIYKTVELGTEAKLLLDIETGRLVLNEKNKQAQLEELTLRAQNIDQTKAEDAATKALAEAKKTSAAFIASLAKEIETQEQLNQKLRDQVQEIGLNTEQLNALKLARLDAAIATQEQLRAQMSLQTSSQEEIDQLEQKIMLLRQQRGLTAGGQILQVAADEKEKTDKASKEYADTLHNDLKGAFSTAFRDSSGEPLKAFGDALANVVYSRAATALAEAATNGLLNSAIGSAMGGAPAASGGSSLMSLASMLLPSFDGGGHTGIGPRSGGLDGKGGFMAMLHPSESVVDHTKGQGTTNVQPVTVVQNFTVGDVASVSMVQKAVANSERRIAGAMGRSMNYGGALA